MSSNRGSKPGERRGGRVKGVPNKKTAAVLAAVEASGETPLQYMLRVMRDPKAEPARRDDMAKAAGSYVHPKLQPVDGKTGSSEVQARVRVEFVGSAT
jgi:hypothetical protein